MKSMRPIFKIKMVIYHLQANLGEKILFGKITHLTDPETTKLLGGSYGNREFHVPFWSTIYLALKFALPV